MMITRYIYGFLTAATLFGSSLPVSAIHPYREHRFDSYRTLPECEEGDILFVGNSITNMMNWWEAFGSRDNIRGRGNSGALSQELLDNFDNIVKGTPSKVFLMIGTNDLGQKGEFFTPDSVAIRIEEFLRRTRKKLPRAEIYYQSILPSLVSNRTRTKTEMTNALVRQWMAEQNDPLMTYVDLYNPMVEASGSIKNVSIDPSEDALSFDDLHLTQRGYQVWLDIIKDYVGYEPVYGSKAVNTWGGLRGSNGMRVSYFGALPVKNTDILLIGDEMIHNGEWQERMHNTNIKDRGIGWGFPGLPIKAMEGMFDPILSGNVNNGVEKELPKAITFYGGTNEIQNGVGADSIFHSYSHAISMLREKAPGIPVFAMTLMPFPAADTAKNNVIAEFNNRIINELVNPAENIYLIDLYHVAGGKQRIEEFFINEESPFLSGDGYVAVSKSLREALDDLTSLSDYSLLPKPQKVIFSGKQFTPGDIKVSTPSWSNRVSDILENISLSDINTECYSIECRIDTLGPYSEFTKSKEAYSISATPNGTTIKAFDEKGIYWGLITLNQLLKKNKSGNLTLPEVEIIDWPAFPIRGFMMDTGRSFISLDELKGEIEAMSRLKMNTFHWHFTENQGWRLESLRFPQLNDSVNMLRHHGQYYTIAQVKELVKWAKERNITVIPEIDMPGHSKAFEMTFGFDMQSEQGIEVLKQLVDEACETFSEAPYFHVGTDEVMFTNQQFVPEMVQFVRDHGKKVISWNPGWKYAPGEIDMVQMWSYRGKPTVGIPAIDSRFHYINHFDNYADMVALYRSNIYGETSESDQIKGMTLALWNDRLIDNEKSLITQNHVYPLMAVSAERGWDGGGTEYFDSLGTNIAQADTKDFKEFADFERRLLAHKNTTFKNKDIHYVKQTNVKWAITEAFPNNGNMNAVFPPEVEGLRKEYYYKDSIYTTREATGAGIYLRHVWGETIPAFYTNPQPDHTAYAFTNIFSPINQKVGLQVETQNYSRSEADIPPIEGTWDYRGSRIWVNGIELQPPHWTAQHSSRDNEIALGNENSAAREPMIVELHKGWNRVMLKLPIGKFQTPEVRLVKWMFTFVVTTPDGTEAAPGIVYSAA